MSNNKTVGDKSEFDFADNANWLMEYVKNTCPHICWVRVVDTSTFNREEMRQAVVAKLDLTTEVYAYTNQLSRDAMISNHGGRYIAGWPPHIPMPGAAAPQGKVDYLEITRQIVAGQ